jgi:acyl-CoA synthetase (AMP-forming)/AMP-acid ligase II/alkylation response protein AidB-like acyl-CoA dehydrogenase/acyl carrier protein
MTIAAMGGRAATRDVRHVAGDLIVDVLADRARRQGDRVALTHLAPSPSLAATATTYGALDGAARAVAAALARAARPGERVLLLVPPGSEFPRALFGAFYAGMIAVPAAVPDEARLQRTLPRLRAIVADARPAVVLTTAVLLPRLEEVLAGGAPEGGSVSFVTVDGVDPALASTWRRPPELGPEALALLQYTSGSTASPKGVMITHANLMAAAAHLKLAWRYREDSRALLWVPDSHDDGLVHGNVLPIFAGHPCWRMSAAEVVRRPASWLEAISRLGITHSGGPNFVYELCVRKIEGAVRERLDLSRWQMAYNAAEPIRAATLDRFTAAFAPCGFSAASHFPAYGLAEATLLVTTRQQGAALRVLKVDVGALEREGRVVPGTGERGARTLVSCGAPVGGTRVEIVDPKTLERRADCHVGEVLIASPSLAGGYWGQPEATRETFLDGFGDPPARFLRTGDLGFVDGGELFIAGRRKDLLIVRGRNLYPHDIELTAESSSPSLRPGCGAAFSVERDDEEQLVVVQEVEAAAGGLREICRRIFQQIVEQHEVRPHAVVLISPRTIDKTSSGKIQRGACKAAFLEGRLATLEQYPAGGRAPAAGAAGIVSWLRTWSESRLSSLLMDERRSMPPDLVLELGNHGVFGMMAGAAHGGLGLGARALAAVLEQLGAIDLTVASFVLGQNLLGVHPIAAYASEKVKRDLLPLLTSGRLLSALAFTEEGAGSNPLAIAAVGRWDEGSQTWTLEGSKIWSGTAGWAGVINVFVRVDGGPDGRQGITGFVLERHKPGLRVGSESLTMGLRGMVQSAVHLEGAQVSVEELLGPPGEGMRVAQETFGMARLGLGAMAVGGMKRCAQLMARYARRRTVATGRLLDHPVILVRLSELAAAITALECLVESCARRFDAAGTLPVDAATTCKIAGAEWLWQAADDLVQTLGGRGYVETNLAPRMLRDARLLRIFEGPTEVLLAHLGSRAAQGEADLFAWLEARDPEGAADLRRALAGLKARSTPGWNSLQALPGRLWLRQRVGELTHWEILRAAVREARADRGAAQRLQALEEASAWLGARFQRLERDLEEGELAERVVLHAERIDTVIDSYGEAIGDLQQAAGDEDRVLDPLLRREERSARPAPAEPPAPRQAGAATVARPAETQLSPGTAVTIEAWLIAWIARHLDVEREAVEADSQLSLYLDSVVAVMLVDDLAGWLGRPLDPALPWSYPSIRAMSHALAVAK